MFSMPRYAALLGGALLALTSCALDAPRAGAETLTAEEARADLDRLYTGLRDADANLFSDTDPAVFERRYHELRSEFSGDVAMGELFTSLQGFAALARHSHTRLEGLHPDWRAYVEGGGLLFPLDLIVEEGEVIVSGAPAGGDIRPGDRIYAVNGVPNSIWLAGLTQYISAETPEFAYAQMANGAAYHVWQAYGPQDRFTFDVERGGHVDSIEVAAIPLDQLANIERLEAGFTLEGREARMISADIAYLRPGIFLNPDAETPQEYYSAEALSAFTGFVDEAFAGFIAAGAEHLILDLRDNPGGDSSFSDPVVAWFADEPFRFASDFRIRVSAETTASNQARLEGLPEEEGGVSRMFADLYAGAALGELVSFDLPYAHPREGERFHGEVHVLVNRYSYSNAVAVAAMIQDYGFGTIYGEQTRDMATTYGAMEHFTLPHSGFLVGYPKAHIIRPNGAEHSHPVEPDVALPVPAIRGERDVMLEALLERLS